MRACALASASRCLIVASRSLFCGWVGLSARAGARAICLYMWCGARKRTRFMCRKHSGMLSAFILIRALHASAVRVHAGRKSEEAEVVMMMVVGVLCGAGWLAGDWCTCLLQYRTHELVVPQRRHAGKSFALCTISFRAERRKCLCVCVFSVRISGTDAGTQAAFNVCPRKCANEDRQFSEG